MTTTLQTECLPVAHIVDDDEGVRQSLAALLLARGYTVHTFRGGESFLAEAALDHPGCVLLDLRMEGLSGLQVFHELGQRHSALKTVFLSAHGELSSAVAAVKQGAVDWLEKPCNEATLLAAVEKASALSQAQARQAQRAHPMLQARQGTARPQNVKIMPQEKHELGYIFPPTPLNFSINETIFWKTACFFVLYCGFNGLSFGNVSFNSVPFSVAYSRFKDVRI